MTHPNGRQNSEDFGSQGGRFSRDKTHCDRGHEFTKENTRYRVRKSKNPDWPDMKRRICVACAKEQDANYRARKEIVRIYNEVLAEQATEQ